MNHNCFNVKPINQSQMHCIDQMNLRFSNLDAIERIELAATHLPENFAMTSSFGIDAAVSLHIINQVIPGIPVVLIDTGYLFKETYRYADQLTEAMGLNLQVHQSPVSAARFESQKGKLWLSGLAGLEQYNQLRKIQPLEHALTDLSINSWFTGVRRSQSRHRQNLPWVTTKDERYKIHPILDWSDRDMFMYLKDHGIPQHPLFDQGYLTVGDTHSTKSIHEVNKTEELRFFGLKRECGIHE